MAHPTLVNTATTHFGGDAATEHDVTLPANTATGDHIFIFFRSATNLAGQGTTVPTGWSRLGWPEGENANDERDVEGLHTTCIYRVADGSEDETVTVTLTHSRRFSAVAFAVRDASSWESKWADELSLSVCPELTPTWVNKDTLWVALCGSGGTGTNQLMNAAPTGFENYTFVLNQNSTDSNSNYQQAFASKDDTSDALAPGAFGLVSDPLYSPDSLTLAFEGTASTRYGVRITDIKEPNESDQLVTGVANATVYVWLPEFDEGAPTWTFTNQSITAGALEDIELAGIGPEESSVVVTVHWDAGGGETKFFRYVPSVIDLDA